MRKVLCCAGAIAGAVLAVGASAAMADEYVVLYKQDAEHRGGPSGHPRRRRHDRHREHRRRRGDGQSSDPSFVKKADAEAALDGAARNQAIGHVPGASTKPAWRDIESERGNFQGNGPRPQPVKGDPLSGLQWDMQLIGATPTGSYAHDQGSHAVRVGIMDTGVDGKHPDIAPNFDRFLSRNFTVDNSEPGIDDGPCEHPSCVDRQRRGRRRPWHARGQHDRLAAQRPRDGRRRPEGRHRQHPRRPGHGLLPPPADGRRPHLRRPGSASTWSTCRSTSTRGCSTARRNPADSPERAGAAEHDHRRHDARGRTSRTRHGVTLIAAEGNESTDLGQSDLRRHAAWTSRTDARE